MKIVFVIALLLIVNCGNAQSYTLDKKSKIEKNIEKYLDENKRIYKKTDTMDVLIYIINDSLSLPYGYLFYFNYKGLCLVQEDLYNCDSCRDVAFQNRVNSRSPKWHKLSTGDYKTKFPYGNLITTVDKANGISAIRYAFKGWKEEYVSFFKKFEKDKYQTIINLYIKELVANSFN
ncbi:MAG: hypothetical protein RIR31_1581 [Bacteroidota bacterium]|jgi:hypothetical protein